MDCSMSLSDLLRSDNLDGLFLKMSPDCLIATLEEILQLSSIPWTGAGIVFRGEYLTLNSSEHPRDVEESSLSEVLAQSVPLRFFLTTDHLQSLLDRASARKKPLPIELEKAIKNQISILSNMPQLEESIQQARSQKDFVMTEKLGRLIQEAVQMLSVRRMTPSEYEKLQGFPVDWTLVDSES